MGEVGQQGDLRAWGEMWLWSEVRMSSRCGVRC